MFSFDSYAGYVKAAREDFDKVKDLKAKDLEDAGKKRQALDHLHTAHRNLHLAARELAGHRSTSAVVENLTPVPKPQKPAPAPKPVEPLAPFGPKNDH